MYYDRRLALFLLFQENSQHFFKYFFQDHSPYLSLLKRQKILDRWTPIENECLPMTHFAFGYISNVCLMISMSKSFYQSAHM